MTEKKIIERHFSDTSQVWRDRIYKAKETQRWWEYFDKQYRFDYVVSMITSIPYPARVLDIGCGAGQLIPVLAEMGHVVDANDISQNMVNLAKTLCKKTGVKANIKLGDCENLDYGDNSFDVVVAMGVIEYMDEDPPILGEIFRVLKPGGSVIITCRNARCGPIKWRTLWLFLIGKMKDSSYQPISRQHDPRQLRIMSEQLSFKTAQEQYCHYHAVPAPFSHVWPFSWIQAVLGKSMESFFKNNPVPWLASTYILKCEKL